jgi:trans-aconitate 2-methyltransferase
MDRLRFRSPDEATAAYAAAGFTDIRAWLNAEPVTFSTQADMETYLAAVFLGPLTDRPADELPALARAIVERLPEPVLDYVRLNIVARRA